MFRQDRANPGTRVSQWKGRHDTAKGWPGSRVSTWLNGGLFGGGDVDYWVALTNVTLATDTTYIEFSVNAADYNKYEVLKMVATVRGANTTGISNSLNMQAPGGNSWTSGSGYVNGPYWSRVYGSGANGCKMFDINGGNAGSGSHPYNQSVVEFFLEKRNAAQQGGSMSTGAYLAGQYSARRSSASDYQYDGWQAGFVQVYVAGEATSFRVGTEQYGQSLETGSQATLYGLDFEA